MQREIGWAEARAHPTALADKRVYAPRAFGQRGQRMVFIGMNVIVLNISDIRSIPRHDPLRHTMVGQMVLQRIRFAGTTPVSRIARVRQPLREHAKVGCAQGAKADPSGTSR